MRKIAFFLGRSHHASKLMPISRFGLEQGSFVTDILVADNAINIDPPTEFLSEFGIKNFHHSKQYQSAVDDADVFRTIRSVFKTDIIKSVAPFWIAYSCREALENLSGFRNYLAKNKPDAVFVLHTQNFWTKMLAYQAGNMKIPVYSLQEGIILENEERDMGKYRWATEYATNVFTWAEHDRQFYGEPDKVVPVGPTHLDKWINLVADDTKLYELNQRVLGSLGLNPSIRTLTVAFPRLDLFKGNPDELLGEVGSWCLRNGIQVVVTLHPFQGGVPIMDTIVNRYPQMVMYRGTEVMELVVCSDGVVAQTGTLPLEAVALGVPVAEANLGKEDLDQPLYKEGGAILLDEIDKLEDLLEDKNAEDAKKFRAKRLPLADGKSLERLTEHIVNGWN